MITPPPEWERALGHQLLVLTPPSGRAVIRYHERVAPARFVDIVDAVVGSFRRTSMGPIARFVTDEGEYGAWCALSGEDDDGAARRWIGAVLCDEFAAAIDGVSRDERDDELVQRTTRWLITHASFGLGERRRRFLYARPPGWAGTANGLVATYLPPEGPRHRAWLEVHPAEPSALSPDEAFEEILGDEERRGLERSGMERSVALVARGALRGKLYTYAGRWPTTGERQTHDVAVLADGRYRYVVRLESVGDGPAERDRDVLHALTASIERLPQPGGRTPDAAVADDVNAPWLE